MDMEWLKSRDAEFFKNRHREHCAQLVLAQKEGLKAQTAIIQEKIERFLALGTLSAEEATNIEVDVRASQAEVESALKQSS